MGLGSRVSTVSIRDFKPDEAVSAAAQRKAHEVSACLGCNSKACRGNGKAHPERMRSTACWETYNDLRTIIKHAFGFPSSRDQATKRTLIAMSDFWLPFQLYVVDNFGGRAINSYILGWKAIGPIISNDRHNHCIIRQPAQQKLKLLKTTKPYPFPHLINPKSMNPAGHCSLSLSPCSPRALKHIGAAPARGIDCEDKAA